MSAGNGERGLYIPTGWRIVGAGAEAIAERAVAHGTARLEPGPPSETLYAVQFTLEPRVRGRPVVEGVLDAVATEIRNKGIECPRFERDREVELPASRFGGLRFEVLSEPGKEWLGELIWRSVHPMVAGAPITTRVLIEDRPSYTRVGVRVTADEGLASVRGVVGAGQAQPAFVRGLREAGLIPIWLGAPVGPRFVRNGEIPNLVESVLSSPDRTTPTIVLAPLEEGGYVVPPEDLAWELFGRGRLYVLKHHEQTFELTDTVGGRGMSCYWGAARAYLPGWSRHDDPYAHPLLVGSRISDPVMRAAWLGELGVWLGSKLDLQPSIAERREERRARKAAIDRRATLDRASTASTSTDGASADGASLDRAAADRPTADRTVTDHLADHSARGPSHAGGSPEGDHSSASTSAMDARAGESPPASPPGAPTVVPATGVAPHGIDSGLAELLLTELRRLGGVLERLTGVMDRLGGEVEEISSGVTRMTGEAYRLADEVERLRTISAVRASSTAAIERRLGRLEDILEEVFPAEAGVGALDITVGSTRALPELDDEVRATLVEVVQDVAESQSDALVFLESARDSAMASPYEDPERVRAILEAMARVARRRRDGLLGTSLREAFADLGIDYRGAIAKATPARLREQYRFTWGKDHFEAEEHIALGNTYDPRRCLRIYFSSRIVSEPRFVIAHVGRHFEVITST